ncbi:tetratricopeptide repeat protein [Thalassotalea aquiviva]|uniref:tetratricopeptide repeat protein n=1 Tax=Thalassotalea aquiviva TaxID=3242415 RepID=UPI00352B015B
MKTKRQQAVLLLPLLAASVLAQPLQAEPRLVDLQEQSLPTVVAQSPAQLSEAEQVESWYQQGADAHRRHDLMAAFDLLTKAANKNHTKAQSLLGYLYLYSDYVEQAIPMLTRAADKGDLLAINELVSHYARANPEFQDYPKAVAYLQKGMGLNDSSSIFAFADALEYGKLGLAVEPAKALKLYQKLSDQDFDKATLKLIDVHTQGLLGQSPNAEIVATLKARLGSKTAKQGE